MRKSILSGIFWILIIISLGACLEIKEIEFIDFKAGFQSPDQVRVGDQLVLLPGAQTSGSKNQQWYIPELDTLLGGPEFRFAFDSVGVYTIRLIVEIQKNTGLEKDSIDQDILVLPITDSLFNQQSFGDLPQDELFQDVLLLPNAAGFIVLSSQGINTLEIRKLDSLGNEVWRSAFPNLTRGRIEGRNIQLTQSGDLLIAGSIQAGTIENDAFIILLEIQEDQQRAVVKWQEIISSVENEFYTSITEVIQNSDTSFYAIGTVSSNGQTTLLLDRYSTGGVLRSSRTFEEICSSCRSQNSSLITEGEEPRLIVAGQEIDNPAIFEFLLSQEGAVLQNKTVLNGFQGQAIRPLPLSDGKFALIGSLNFGNADSTQAFMAKLDVISEGAIPTWVSTLNFYQEGFADIFEDLNGDLLAIGTHFNPLSGEDIIFGRFDTFSGRLIQSQLFGSPQNEGARRLILQNQRWISFGFIESNTFLGFRDIQLSPLPLAEE